MKISMTVGGAILAVAAFATSCATIGGKSAHGDKVYLVGVAGGG